LDRGETRRGVCLRRGGHRHEQQKQNDAGDFQSGFHLPLSTCVSACAKDGGVVFSGAGVHLPPRSAGGSTSLRPPAMTR